MLRQKLGSSFDASDVEPCLVRASGGSHPQAAVAWKELYDATEGLATDTDVERALAALFCDIKLTGGVTERREGLENSGYYYYTKFLIDVPTYNGKGTGEGPWATKKISDDSLLDEDGQRQNIFYDFKIIDIGVVSIEFQSASQNPVVADDALTLVLQRRPSTEHLSRLIDKDETYEFFGGAKIYVNDDYTLSLFRADNTLEEQQGVFVSRKATKVSPQGFICLVEDGSFLEVPDNSYVRYHLADDRASIVLPPRPSSQREYERF